jgi:hypothetical protein
MHIPSTSSFGTALLTSFALLLPACVGAPGAREDAPGAVGKGASEWVAPDVFQQAFGIVSAVDYLPFRYKVDGCYARALYMGMELASNRIPSNAVFAFAQPGYPLTVGSVEWSYHVAPMLEVGNDTSSLTPMVLDPSLSGQKLTQDDWLHLMGKGPQDVGPDAAPQMLFVPSSDYAPSEAQNDTTWANVDVPDFASMPAFNESDIQSACNVMYNYLSLETADPNGPDAATKQGKLVARTGALVQLLDGLGKLNADYTFSADECASSSGSF